MVCGCSWSMKMKERSVAMASQAARTAFSSSRMMLAQFAAQLGIAGVVDGERHGIAAGALRQVQGIEPVEVAEDFGWPSLL